jgi:hypothetical protein
MSDMSSFFLMSQISQLTKPDNTIFHLLILLILTNSAAIYRYILPSIDEWFKKTLHSWYKISSVDIEGWEFIYGCSFQFEYPFNMTAINYYVYSNNKSTNFRYFNEKRNGIYYLDDIKATLKADDSPNYMLAPINDVEIADNIMLSVSYVEQAVNNPDVKHAKTATKITLKLWSKLDLKHIEQFMDKCILNYENYINEKNKNKTYHFIYQGKKEKDLKLKFSAKLISDYSNPDSQNYETFDNIFHSNKQKLINDILKLSNIDHYKRTGQKRKKGYLFYGKPGTGKSSTVMALSNFDKRHIIEIQLDRVKTNAEFEEILALDSINDIKICQNNTIYFFDEIDINTKLNKNKNPNPPKPDPNLSLNLISNLNADLNSINESDKLSMSTLLSRFDGIGNYSGLIIIAATNDISKIDPALYRDGRLNLMYFDYATAIDIKNIIEKYHEIQLSAEQIQQIQQTDKIFPHSTIRAKIEDFETPDEFIQYITSENTIANLSNIDSSVH